MRSNMGSEMTLLILMMFSFFWGVASLLYRPLMQIKISNISIQATCFYVVMLNNAQQGLQIPRGVRVLTCRSAVY
jgi:hypothetical protein